MCLHKDGGSGTGENSVASGGVDDRQGIAPRGPMRGEAVGAASCSGSVAWHRATAASCDSA